MVPCQGPPSDGARLLILLRQIQGQPRRSTEALYDGVETKDAVATSAEQ